MKFDTAETKRIYSDRKVDPTWQTWCTQHLSPQGKRVVDIGCGGGIYAYGFSALGAKLVIGVDQSQPYIDDAGEEFREIKNLQFVVGSAMETQLDDNSADIVFERALIHHLPEEQQAANASECYRLLDNLGVLVVQDRTMEDVVDTRSGSWIRSTLIEAFPHLIEFERKRRPIRAQYTKVLESAGFGNPTTVTYEEVRKRYSSFKELKQEVTSRKGKSILYELDDAQLKHYCQCLEEKSTSHELIERDLWTVWLAEKPER